MVLNLVKYEDVKDVTAYEYFKGNSYVVSVFNKKYAFTKKDGNVETPAEVFWRVAYYISRVEDSKARADLLADMWFSLMWNGWFRPGGSILAGVESEQTVSLMNCTTVPIEADTLEAIGKADTEIMKMASRRQGVGFDLSKLRPKSSKINNSALFSEGVVNWLCKYNDVAFRVGQRGRLPALLGSLMINHPDIEEFITAKDNIDTINNINISIQIVNDFMQVLEEDKEWELRFDVENGREIISRTVKASDLFDKIAVHAHTSAEPGVQYRDLLQDGLMYTAIAKEFNDDRYLPHSSNACCFVDSTKVVTNMGTLSIGNIRLKLKAGESVQALSKNISTGLLEFKEVVDVFDREGGAPVQTITLELDNGRSIECTPDHKFFTTNRGIVQAKDLTYEDGLVPIVYNNVKVKKITINKEKKPTYNIEVKDNHNYFVEGVLVKNSEKFMAPYSTCNLLSLNMENFSTDPILYKKELSMVVPSLVRFADNVISYELATRRSPLAQQEWIVERLREVGLGITNIHGWLLKQDLPYDSDEGIDKVEDFMKNYAYTVFKASMELGMEKGSAPAWSMLEDKTKYMQTTYFRNIVNEFFEGDANKVTHMRNMAHISIAPTGSISSTFPSPCISSGVEPVMGLYYWRKTRALTSNSTYQYFFTVPNRLLDYIVSKMDPASDDFSTLSKFSGSELDDDGSLGKALIPIIHKYVDKDFIKPSHEIDPLQKIKLMSKLYKWMDASISCTFNLREDVTIDVVKQVYFEAYKQGVRAVSIYRDGCRPGVYIFEDPITNKNKFTTKQIDKARPEQIIPVYSPKRPKELLCNIHHCSVKGTPWLVLVGMLGNAPYEVFAGEAEDLYLPKTCKSGKIIKCTDGTYSLVVVIRKTEVEYKNLAYLLMDTEQRALTRLISLSIRHGCPVEFVQQQLKKANGDITNFSTVVARVLGSYIKSMELIGESAKCPSCGQFTMVMEEGCTKCSNPDCGFARCE